MQCSVQKRSKTTDYSLSQYTKSFLKAFISLFQTCFNTSPTLYLTESYICDTSYTSNMLALAPMTKSSKEANCVNNLILGPLFKISPTDSTQLTCI